MKVKYPACVFKDETGYAVVFPDLNFLATSGETLEEAMGMAKECLAGYILCCKEDGDIIPPPSSAAVVSVETVANELGCEYIDGFVTIVALNINGI